MYKAIEPSMGPDYADPQRRRPAGVPVRSGTAQPVVWFGMDCQSFSTDHSTGIYDDGKYRPLCRAPMAYDYYHYNHIGAYLTSM